MDQTSYQSTWFGQWVCQMEVHCLESKSLVKNINGKSASGAFSQSSVVGMLLYLYGHTCPDITFGVNCCTQNMFWPKHVHELPLKHIGHVDWNNPNSNHVYFLEVRLSALFTLTTLSSGAKTQWRSMTQHYNCMR